MRVESPKMLGEGLGVRGVTRMGRFSSPWDHPIQYGTPSRSKGDEYRCSQTGEKGTYTPRWTLTSAVDVGVDVKVDG